MSNSQAEFDDYYFAEQVTIKKTKQTATNVILDIDMFITIQYVFPNQIQSFDLLI